MKLTTNITSGPKSSPNSDSFWVRRLFNVCVRVFCTPNATILLVYIYTRQDQNELHLKRWFFLTKWASSVSRSPDQLAKRICNWTLYGHAKFFSMMSPKCWWRFTHTFCHSSNILGCTHNFWLFTFWFIDEDASFFHFFHKITNMWSWRCLSSSKIRTQLHSTTLPWFSK